jgi:FMN-dependent dehydrogenase
LTKGTLDWSAIRFRPRVLRDIALPTRSTTVLGTPVRTPVLVAPMAYQVGAHPDGERAMGRAVAAAGSCSACQPTPPFLCCHCRHRRAVVVPAGDQDLTDDLARVMIQIGAGSIAELPRTCSRDSRLGCPRTLLKTNRWIATPPSPRPAPPCSIPAELDRRPTPAHRRGTLQRRCRSTCTATSRWRSDQAHSECDHALRVAIQPSARCGSQY